MLTLPLALAALSAGAIGGVHCVGMCGGISSLLSQQTSVAEKVIPIVSADNRNTACASRAEDNSLRYQVLLHSGRLLTYMLIGAVFGGMGAAGVFVKAYLPVQKIFYVIGNLALLLLGMRLLGLRPAQTVFELIGNSVQRFTGAIMPGIFRHTAHPFLIGMSWGCLPCGLLLGISPFAFLSGDAYSGAALMFLFGVAALPHLLLVQSLNRWQRPGRYFNIVRYVSAAALILIALLGLWYFDMRNMPAFLCVTQT